MASWQDDEVVTPTNSAPSAGWEQDEVVSAAPAATPSALAVAGNAAYKGLAGAGDFILNIAGAAGEGLIPYHLRPKAMQDPLHTGMEAVGLIKPENEPQTPGQRILDMAVQAGVNTALAPSKSLVQTGYNAVRGIVSGGLAGITKEATGSDLAATAVAIATPLLIHAAVGSTANEPTRKNPVKSGTLREAQKAGYVVPPSQVKPSFTTNKLESLGGKAAVRQEAALRNVETTTNLAAKAVGLPDGTYFTKDMLDDLADDVASPYRDVASLSPRAASALEQLKQSRAESSDHWMDFARGGASGRAEARKAAMAADAKALQLERVIGREAQRAGQPALVQELRDARTRIAKIHAVKAAINEGDGTISAPVIARMLKSKPLTGELNLIARFAKAFPSVAREGASIPAAGVSGTDPAAAALLATVGYGAAGGPAGLVAGGAPLLRGVARPVLLSDMYQKRLLQEPPSLNQALLQSILAGRSVADATKER